MMTDMIAQLPAVLDLSYVAEAKLPFANASFDMVTSDKFFTDKPTALPEICRVLVAGGTAVLSVLGSPDRYSVALAEALERHAGPAAARRSLELFAFADAVSVRNAVKEAGFREAEISSSVLIRRVLPSQEWLLRNTAALPCADDIAGLDATTRASVVREIAASLKDLWNTDSFVVPSDVYSVYARK